MINKELTENMEMAQKKKKKSDWRSKTMQNRKARMEETEDSGKESNSF